MHSALYIILEIIIIYGIIIVRGGIALKQFIDRETELQVLEKEYSAQRSSLVILYGRRRVGKTALIAHFIKEKPALYFLATEESEAQNLDTFRMLAADYLDDALLRTAHVDRWDVVFDVLVKRARTEKLVIVLDEFQYLGKANEAFPSVFQRIWDTQLQDANVMVILCGSLITMMESQTLNYKSPLYGRRTAQIKLRQIPFRYYREFYPGRTARELVERYSVTGGVPKYIELFEDQTDIFDAIREHVLNRSGFLYEEPTFLLQNEVTEIGSYFSIIKTIAAGNQKPGKIASLLGVPPTNLPKYFKTLIDLDILEREVPVTEANPEKSKQGLYKIKDHFLQFWFRFLYPYLSYLESGRDEIVLERLRKNFVDNHAAFVFEDICRQRLWDLSAEGDLPFLASKVGRWWDRQGNEIDAVALAPEDGQILFGECKFWTEPVGANILAQLEEKAKLVDWKRGARREWYTVFSVSGFTPELRQLAAQRDNVFLYEIL